VDLRTLLQNRTGDEELKRQLEEAEEKHRKDVEGLQATITELKDEAAKVQELSEALESVKAELNYAQERLKSYAGLDQAIRGLVESNIELLLPKHLRKPTESPPSLSENGKLVVEQTQYDVEVQVHREKVTPSEATLRGQLAILIAEGELDKSLSMRSIAERLRDLGYSAPGKGLSEELAWYVKNRILQRDAAGYWKVRDKSRVTLREATV
jgi:hypothetical protein